MAGNGNHRAYIMSAINQPTLPVSIVKVVDRKTIEEWPNVKNGEYAKTEAEEIFDMAFEGETLLRGCV